MMLTFMLIALLFWTLCVALMILAGLAALSSRRAHAWMFGAS